MKPPPEIETMVMALCAERRIKPLFLTLFGSTLYGTDIEGKSDLDIRGIFLPSLPEVILGKAPETVHFSTSGQDRRNNSRDFDLDLWSLRHWLLKLLPDGDIGALDLLFAHGNTGCTLYLDPRMNAVFHNSHKFVNLYGQNGYAQYCMRQAKKYGIRGSRIGTLKAVCAWLDAHSSEFAPKRRLHQWLDIIERDCGNSYCTRIISGGEPALRVSGKIYQAAISMDEFSARIKNHFRQCGGRAILAEQDQGLDFKALSHAVRALSQIDELVETGRITYPLKNRKILKDIKLGRYTWSELESMIAAGLNRTGRLCAECGRFGNYDRALAESIILSFYDDQIIS